MSAVIRKALADALAVRDVRRRELIEEIDKTEAWLANARHNLERLHRESKDLEDALNE